MRDAHAREAYHYLHCNMRLRHRYGLEMTLEEYQALSEQFRTRRGLVNPRTDDRGNLEAWVQFKGTWVCASYRPGLRLVGTIMPAPPVFPSEEAQRAARLANQVEALTKENEALREAVSSYQSRLAKTENSLTAAHQSITGVTRADVTWFKRRMQDAEGYLKSGEVLEAFLTLNAAVSLPRGFRPSADPEASQREMEARVASERLYWSLNETGTAVVINNRERTCG